MSLKYGLLGLLNYGPMTGYELYKVFKDSLSFFWQAQTSQIYRELSAMERNGWLTSERVMQNEKPNKKVYSITDMGRAELLDWLVFPEADVDDAKGVRSAFLMRVFFAGEMEEEQALDMIRAYREECQTSINGLSEASGAINKYGASDEDDRRTKYWKIAEMFGETFYHAGLEWSEKAINILEGKK
jgi:DNA-binding PadR family transcriptional regulator